MRLARVSGQSVHSMTNGAATSSAKAASSPSPPPTKAMRMKKVPPAGSVECWSEATMFAPRACRKPAVAATMPGRSGQEMSRRAGRAAGYASPEGVWEHGPMALETLLGFAAAWGLLVLVPGPDTTLALSRALVRGRRAGLVAVAGSASALSVHLVAAGLGLSALLASSSAAFTAVKLAGAAYLVFLGLRLILADPVGDDAPPAAPARGTGYAQAVLTGVLNPKSALFFLTFLPQFVDPAAPVVPQLALLSAITLGLATAWATALVLLADRARGVLGRPRVRARIDRLTGTVFVVFGTRLAGAGH